MKHFNYVFEKYFIFNKQAFLMVWEILKNKCFTLNVFTYL